MHTINETLISKVSDCATTCDYCAASCLQESDVTMMATCIQLDLECAAVCRATAMLLQLGSNHASAMCQICADICNACAEECEKHEHEHCRKCAAICRECAEECVNMTAA